VSPVDAAANFDRHSPAKVDTANEMRGPLLLIMGGKDHTAPEAVTRATLKQYRHSDAVTDLTEFADRAHSLTIDHGWPRSGWATSGSARSAA
jgi:dienelactone hydrolase